MTSRLTVAAVATIVVACIFTPTALSFGLERSAPKYSCAVIGASDPRDLVDNEKSVKKSIPRRREMLENAAVAILGASMLTFPSPARSETLSVLRSKGCYRGEGEACDELADGNEFIRSLQKKSVENREMNDREALNAYNMKNFPEFFASLSPPKYLVKQPDGMFGVYTDAELTELKKMGKIKVENPKAKGGKFADLTQKPMLVLVE